MLSMICFYCTNRRLYSSVSHVNLKLVIKILLLPRLLILRDQGDVSVFAEFTFFFH